ncbi:GGDEF domain-containing protein [Planococcus shenhongbingii]|uniref:Diguanylate cyclase n=1 Tax=Planococcus shenhongbingii TaxID=3058398 RepID=A0ABT8NG66_9BACL|nr:diguanylate cyclase [Planococcus sp. N017]MDN7246883.1 diguanylate cyclase [Planococcus sp. N017]
MDLLLYFFVENMALIIALMYLALKMKELFLLEMSKHSHLLLLSSLFISFLTFSVMYNPYVFEGMRLDLREVPLFFITYVGGWKFGVLSAIIPAGFRASMGGPTVEIGILQSILFPVLIGALFHDKRPVDKFFPLIDLKRMIIGFVVFEVLKSIWMFFYTPVNLAIIVPIFFFALIAVLAMAMILNEENRTLLLRKELEMYSNQDSLTRLPNIRFFKNKVGDLLSKNTPMLVSMIDVDYFKVYNDTHGHQKGDSVLRTLGQLLMESAREEDIVARYGGEEFIICYTNVSKPEEVIFLAERFRKKVEEHKFEGEELQPGGKLTVSMGLSFSSENRTLEQMIEEADQALYLSKRRGKNQVTIYEAS